MTVIVLFVNACVCAILFKIFKPKRSGFEYFAKAEASLTWSPVFFSLCATFVGPGLSLGFMGAGATSGWLFLTIGFLYATQLICTGLFVVPTLRSRFPKALSITDLLGNDSSRTSNSLKLIIGIITFAIVLGVTGIMIKISGSIAASTFGVDAWLSNLVIASLVAAYSVNGGISASIRTDVLQFTIFVIGLVILIVWILSTAPFSLEETVDHGISLARNEIGSLGYIGLLALTISFTFGDYLQPPILSRLLSARDAKHARIAFISAGCFCLLWFPLILFPGIIGSQLSLAIDDPDQTLFVLSTEVLGDRFNIIVIVMVLLVTLSSHDSLLNSAATVFVRDILHNTKNFFGPNFENLIRNNKIQFARAGIVMCTLLGYLGSLFYPGIIRALLFFASLWIPAVLTPTIYSILRPQVEKIILLAGVFAGAFSSIAFTIIFSDVLPPVIAGFLFSLSCMLLLNRNIIRRKS